MTARLEASAVQTKLTRASGPCSEQPGRSRPAALRLMALPHASRSRRTPAPPGRGRRSSKLRTTASVMHTTAHPDDEHGGVIARLSRRDGARLALHDAQSRRVGRQRHRPAALRRARADPHRGTARRRSLLRRRRAVLHDRGRLRLLEAARGGAREVGPGDRAARRGARHPHRAGRSCSLSRFQGNERDGHGNHQTAGLITVAGVPRGGRSEALSRADQGGPAPVAAVQGLHRRRARERGLDRAHRQRRVQPVARRFVRQRGPLRPELPALAEQRPLQRRRRGRNYGYYTRVGSSTSGAPPKETTHLRRPRHRYRACSRRCAAGAGRRGVAGQLAIVDGASAARLPTSR